MVSIFPIVTLLFGCEKQVRLINKTAIARICFMSKMYLKGGVASVKKESTGRGTCFSISPQSNRYPVGKKKAIGECEGVIYQCRLCPYWRAAEQNEDLAD
jgi:hypothetical protein